MSFFEKNIHFFTRNINNKDIYFIHSENKEKGQGYSIFRTNKECYTAIQEFFIKENYKLTTVEIDPPEKGSFYDNGIHKITGTEYDEKGYNRGGWNKNGYNRRSEHW